ncbi:hypothetical protein ACXYMO_00780 [Arenibacterium sp. CAU 1754]
MKICVIGNSHVGMLNQAYREVRPEDMSLTFFAQQGRGPEHFGIRGTELFAAKRDLRRTLRRLGMPIQVDLQDFDAIAVVSMTATVFSILPFVTGYSVYGWPSTEGDIEEMRKPGAPPMTRPLISEPALDAAIQAEIKRNIAHRLVDEVRKVLDIPILLVPQPFPSADVLKDKTRHIGLRRLRWRKDGQDAVRMVRQAHDRVFAARSGVTLLEQPQQTVAHDFLTQPEFARGGAKLNLTGRQPDSDILHANMDYGKLVLDQIRAASSDPTNLI